jgi:hypothetical protein
MVMQQSLQVDALRSAAVDIQRAIQSLPPEALTTPLDEGWSIIDVIGHLLAIDEMMWDRLKLILAEDNPTVVGRVPISPFRGTAITAAEAVTAWNQTRQAMCDWLEALPAGALNRHATHNERGRITLRTEAQIIVDHDTEHLNQLLAMRKRWEDQQR